MQQYISSVHLFCRTSTVQISYCFSFHKTIHSQANSYLVRIHISMISLSVNFRRVHISINVLKYEFRQSIRTICFYLCLSIVIFRPKYPKIRHEFTLPILRHIS